MIRINKPNSKHLYSVEVEHGVWIQVEANNRTQAAAIAKRAGFDVRSISMEG